MTVVRASWSGVPWVMVPVPHYGVLYSCVSAADTVSVRFLNETTGAIDLGSGTLRVRVEKASG
jgi:hypothetical protein